MSAGIRLHNANRQVLVDNQDLCFGLAQKIRITTSNQRPPNIDLPPIGVRNAEYGYFKVSNCHLPMLVYELGGVDKRIHLFALTMQSDGFECCFFSFGGRKTIDFYVFDLPSQCTFIGDCAMRLYRSDGTLSFDSRLEHLYIVGEARHGVALDANRRYGVLLRSKPPIIREFKTWRSRRKIYDRTIDKHQMLWQADGMLHAELVTTFEENNWYWGDTTPYFNPNHGIHHTNELSVPLLVDLTGIE